MDYLEELRELALAEGCEDAVLGWIDTRRAVYASRQHDCEKVSSNTGFFASRC